MWRSKLVKLRQNNMRTIFISTLVAVLVVLGFAHFGRLNSAQAEEERIDFAALISRIAGTVETFINEEVVKRVQDATVKLGSVVGPELFFESWTVNSFKEYRYEQSMGTATTTLCSFIPPSSTTTLVVSADNVNAAFTTGAPTSTGAKFSVYLTDRNGATSTTINLFGGTTTIQTLNGLIVPTSTVATTVPGYINAPDRRILFTVEGGTSNGFGGGKCRIKLNEL